jgi:hypothetical protein
MPYATDLSAQISAARDLAQRVRQLAAVLSLDDERARLLDHAEELERHANEQERLQTIQRSPSPLHLTPSAAS